MTYRTIRQVIARARRLQRAVSYSAVAALVGVFSILPAAVASADTGQADAGRGAAKAAPVAPRDSANGVTAPIAGKDKNQANSRGLAALAYTATLSASSTNLWPK